MDNTVRNLMQCAKDEIDTVVRSLTIAAGDGRKPTIRQLNAIVYSLTNAQVFLKAALLPSKDEG